MISFELVSNINTEFLSKACSKAEKQLANEVLKDTSQFVPADNERTLSRLAHVEGNVVVYPGPYARYLYYGKVMVDSVTGKGPRKIPVGEGGEYVLRFRKGATLVPTDRDLKISQAVNPKAQSHWFEASKAVNLDKWKREAKGFIENDK